MCHFNKIKNTTHGFTVVEIVASLLVLVLIFSSVLTIFNDSMRAVSENRMQAEAFELAREKMEEMLAQTAVTEVTNYGVSDRNPNIEWETRVESFSDPSGSGSWVRAVSAVTYPDANDQPKSLELTCWLSKIPKEVAAQMERDKLLMKMWEMGFTGSEEEFLREQYESGYEPMGGMPSELENIDIDREMQRLIESERE